MPENYYRYMGLGKSLLNKGNNKITELRTILKMKIVILTSVYH